MRFVRLVPFLPFVTGWRIHWKRVAALPVAAFKAGAWCVLGVSLSLAIGVAATAASADDGAGVYTTRFERQASAAELTQLGRLLFADRGLSASGKQACSSCHDPQHAYGPVDARPVPVGGKDARQHGLRAVPSLSYRQFTPAFDAHFRDTDDDDSVDQGPAGGFDWDGRAASAHQQAAGPLLSPLEMANPDRAAAVARLRASSSAAAFTRTFGPHALDDDQRAWKGMLWALEVFQQSPPDFAPFSSKYDAVLRGKATLSEAERRGLALFNDENKGNCAQCHPSSIKRGSFPLFTDFGLIALGVPRNPRIPANRDAGFYDLGLCGPLRTDLQNRAEYCGLFKTPSLRNVAKRRVFFHNGVFDRLEDVVAFYVQRDLDPGRFYPRDRRGRVRRFDDLPARYHDNVNTEPPFDRKPGDAPALNAQEIEEVVAFLKTLSDGYQP